MQLPSLTEKQVPSLTHLSAPSLVLKDEWNFQPPRALGLMTMMRNTLHPRPLKEQEIGLTSLFIVYLLFIVSQLLPITTNLTTNSTP